MASKRLILLARTYEAGRNWVDANATKYHDPYSHSWFVCYTHHDLEKYLNTIAESKDVSGYMMKDFRGNPECGKMLRSIYEHKEKIRPELANKFFDDIQKHL